MKQKERDCQNIIQDAFDRLTWEDLRKKSDVLTQKVVEGQEYLDLFPQLAQDLFASLYKGEPTLKEECPLGTELNRKQVETFMEDRQYDEIRAYTTFDDFSSALACSDVMSTVIQRFKEDEELRKLAEQQNQQGKKNPNDGDGNEGDNGNDFGNRVNQASSKIRQAFRQGLKKAQKNAEEREETFQALGCGQDSGERKSMSFEDKEKLLEQYRKVKNMAKYIGKYRNLSTSARSERITSTRTELCGVTMGADVVRALPQELAELNHPVLKYDFFRKMQEHQLLQYELEVNEPTGMGSIVCLVDDSGSMYQENEYIARGVMFGLLECAKKDKRNFAVDIFSCDDENFSMEIPNGNYTPKQMIELLTVSYGNGTSFEEPLEFAMKTIEKDKFKNADIVMITDMACNLNSEFADKLKAFKEEHDVKVTVIAIGCGMYLNKSTASKWIDNIYTDMGDETLTEVYKNV